jgi:hypothetical protein
MIKAFVNVEMKRAAIKLYNHKVITTKNQFSQMHVNFQKHPRTKAIILRSNKKAEIVLIRREEEKRCISSNNGGTSIRLLIFSYNSIITPLINASSDESNSHYISPR